MNQIIDQWAYMDVPHHPTHKQFVKCLNCGQTWPAEDKPEMCPYCNKHSSAIK